MVQGSFAQIHKQRESASPYFLRSCKGVEMTVNLDGDWREHAAAPPPGGEVLGTVDNCLGQHGALVRYFSTGLYVMVRKDSVYRLNQAQVKTALAPLGL